MPTYEYVCRVCGHAFEIVQSMTDDALTICDVCGGELRKVFTPPSISFKGSGFYATDHGKKSKKADAKADGGGSTSDSGEKKSESGEKKPPSSEKSSGSTAPKTSPGSSTASPKKESGS